MHCLPQYKCLLGVPVATVAINGAENAGLLAIQMLAISDENLINKLKEYKTKMEEKILSADSELQKEINMI